MRRPLLLAASILLFAWAATLAPGIRGKQDVPMEIGKVSAGPRSATTEAFQSGWPYTPPAEHPIPHVQNATWCRNPIDNFVLARLEAKGLKPAPPAGKTTLLRRVYADLVGEPPTPQEAEAFLNDRSPNAYEEVVDRLLADPRYGERWGRHWLDLVRYADSNGFEYDSIRPHAWRYRDYVIRAFNADKPYDRFLKEQIAGDLFYPGDSDALIATGYARLGPWDEANASNKDPAFLAQSRQDYLNDLTDTTGAVVLGLTVGCARCHNHKYDRISQKDYYSLQAFFAPTKWIDIPLPHAEAEPAAFRQTVAQAQAHVEALQKEQQGLRDNVRAILIAAKQKAAKPGEPPITVTDREIDAGIQKRARKNNKRIKDEIARWMGEAAPYQPTAFGIADDEKAPPATHILLRGNLQTPGPEVQPSFVASLCAGQPATASVTPPVTGNTTGRRTALADWLTSKTNPMTAKVMVNRIWQHHFGRGIVGTPSDFGKNGDAPTHPELLDWLALRFMENGWSIKKMHRLMLLSNTYQMSTRYNPVAAKVDPLDKLFWRMNSLRLEGEALRDSILAVSGRLNPEMGGPGVYPVISKEVLSTSSVPKWGRSPEEQTRRRTVYVFQRRSLMLPLIEAFDGPDMSNTCPRRAVTTIAPQALALFNGDFARTEARCFAERVAREAGEDPAQQLDLAYRLALVRHPTAAQTAQALAFLSEQARSYLDPVDTAPDPAARRKANLSALADLCLALVNSNEFLYLD